jgi:YebC/PmpR family DNA-binding regulatory protein
MSGHSKWANIRVKKTAQDARRGKVFTRHARLIEIAARSGGGDPEMNAALRTAIDNAKADSVPNANIERAIKKGTGELKGAGQMEEVIYEAYLPLRSSAGAEGGGPGGAAFIIECLTDNRNRTIANVRSIIERSGGHMAASNAVMWMFERRGVVAARMENGKWKMENAMEQLELELIDFGAEDIDIDGDVIRVTTGMTDWPKIRDFLKTNDFDILSGGLAYIPKQKAPVDEAMMKTVADFIEALEEDEDVSGVHTNAEATAA